MFSFTFHSYYVSLETLDLLRYNQLLINSARKYMLIGEVQHKHLIHICVSSFLSALDLIEIVSVL